MTDTPIKHSYTREDLWDLQPPEAVIQGLLNKREITLIHGKEGSFKSMLVMQLMDCLTRKVPLFGRFEVPEAKMVGVLATEVHPAGMGERLRRMYPSLEEVPANFCVMHEDLLKHWKRQSSLAAKCAIIAEWVRVKKLEVLIVDTMNDFFRGKSDPNSETVTGELLDTLRGMDLDNVILVRHDRKSGEKDNEVHSNELIRGASELREDPELILYLNRVDKRTNQVVFEVGKLRYGEPVDVMGLWFDAGNFRLTAVPPVVSLLSEGPRNRQEIIEAMHARFDVEQRRTDEMLCELRPFLRETQNGHHKGFELAREAAVDQAWAGWLS